MKSRLHACHVAMAAGFSAALLVVLPAMAAPPKEPATVAPPKDTVTPAVAARSAFVIPTNPKEGHDPFFPASTRLYEKVKVQVVEQARPIEMSSLVLKGISGPPENRLAIINNYTFARGDERDIATSQGHIRVRCVEIKANSVVIESAGQRRELKYVTNP